MKRNNKMLMVAVGAAVGGIFMSAGFASAADLLADWNFNDNQASGSIANSTTTAVSYGAGTLTFSADPLFAQVTGGTTLNAYNSDLAGNALTILNGTAGENNGSNLTFSLNTTGYKAPVISYATRGTSTGFTTQDWSYSLDGTNFTDIGTSITGITSSFAGEAVDFSAVTALQNQANVYFRVTLTGGSTTSTSGNNRFDNFQFNAVSLSAPQPRNLVWDGNGTTAPNPSNNDGNFEDANNWYDGTNNQTWDSTRPDNATFGTGSGAGNTTVTLNANETAGTVTFAASSPNYTLNGNQLTIQGVGGVGLVAGSSATINSIVSVSAPQSWSIASGQTLNIGDGSNGGLAGSGSITKTDAGSLILNTPSTFAGNINIDGGEVVVNSADSLGRTGAGVGSVTVNSGATFHLDNVSMGSTATGGVETGLTLNNGATFLGTGISSFTGASSPVISSQAGTVVTIKTLNPSDIFDINTTLRNSVVAATGSTVVIDGPGRVVLSSGATSTSASGTQYSGSWEINNGMLQIGPDAAPFGESINALGFLPSDGPNGPTRPVTINGGLLIAAINAHNPAATDPVTVGTIRSDLTLAGGGIGGTSVNPTFAGSITLQSNSTVQTTDAVDNTTPLTVVLGTQDTVAGSAAVLGNINWGNATLAVNGNGILHIEKTQGTITVTPGAALQVNNGARVELAGTVDALSDGVNSVNVTNNSTAGVGGLEIMAGTKNVGNIDGTGSTVVDSGAGMIANYVRQSALTVNANTQIRENGSATGVSNVATLNLGAGTQLDLTNNKLITNSAVGSFNGTSYTGVTGLVASGRNGGTWNGPGIITSETQASASILTTLGVATGAQAKGLASGATAVWAGQTISDTSTLVMYTYAGDANLDGRINGDDYFAIDSHVNSAGASGYANGDFNYDGRINGDDYFIIDSNINQQSLGVFSTSAGLSSGHLSGVSAVPEPASIGLLGIAGLGLMRRRRRSR